MIKGACAFLRRAVMTGIAKKQCVIPSGLGDCLIFPARGRKITVKSVLRPRLLHAGTGPPDLAVII